MRSRSALRSRCSSCATSTRARSSARSSARSARRSSPRTSRTSIPGARASSGSSRSTSTASRSGPSAARPRWASRPGRGSSSTSRPPTSSCARRRCSRVSRRRRRSTTRSSTRRPRSPARTQRMGLGVKRNHYYTPRREGYFFDFVKQELIDRYGLDTVRRGGLRIDTTIDLRLQKLARKTMDGKLGAADRSAAIVTIDPRTGYIKAMASSSRYGDSKFNLAAQGHRQAGSTFKVMVLMAALRRGVNPNTTTYQSRPLAAGWLPAAPDYSVHTYGNTYAGRINLVKATLKSDNSVYAQLDADVGPDAVRRTAYDMGIKTRLHAYPAEGLGGLTRGVSPLEMANAYSTIAARGWRHRPIAIRKVTFPDGHVDNLGRPRRHRAFSDGVTYEATKILEQNVKAGTGFPNATQIGCPAAGKTGTTDNFTDAWFVGFTPHLTTAVWLGHAKSRVPMPGVAGGTIPAKLWGQYMKQARGRFCGGFH